MSHRIPQIAGIIRSVVALQAVTIPPDIATVVNVTRVDVSRDLSYADVYLTAISGTDGAVRYFAARARDIRFALANELKSLHRQPLLRFHPDKHSQELSKLDQILEKIKK